ncbi:major facilitator superfamily domain-containing protein 10 isoform X2 [Cricetulus griseus]|uniref:Major facilitator superfamily domain-containing protein 10 isoform X2 n=1 Tax=Cricetulus griseus TaxID=10029 RepID=A0A9J7KF10_CRIGR|nr:major facilitator superfamily domain-containing protein 10 isoform X2 [Cricetulus griseus]
MGRGYRLHTASAYTTSACVRAPRGHRDLPRPATRPPGLHAVATSAARTPGEPWARTRPPLWLLAARGRLVCHSHRDASREKVQQCPVWRISIHIAKAISEDDLCLSGLIGSAFSLLQFFSAPLTGAASDCLGRRPVMLLCLTGMAISYAVWAASRSFKAFLASRVIGGISKGNVSLSTAIVADLGSPPTRSQGMAVIGVAFSLAFTVGPMLGAFLSVEMVPWISLLFAVSDMLFIFCFLPETLPQEKRAPSVTLGFHAAANLLSPLALLRFAAVTHHQDPPAEDRLRSLRRLGLVYFLYLFLFSGLEYTLSFLVHQRFQFSSWWPRGLGAHPPPPSLQQGKMFFFIGLTMATIQGTYARRISPGKEVAAVKQAMLLLVPAFLFIGWGHSLPMLGLGLLLYSFAAAVVVPGLSTLVSSYGSPGQKGTIMGILRSLGALGRALGPMVAASVFWLAGARVCFTVCAGLFLLPFFLLRNLRHPAQTFKEE